MIIKYFVTQFGQAFYHAVGDTIDHDGVEHAGYLAFLSLLSFFPFLVFFVAIAGFLGETQAGITLTELLLSNNLLPDELRETIAPRMQEIVSGPPQSLLTIAILGVIWTASSAVEGLRTILNRAYRVGTPPSYILRRLLSILQFLILTAILIIAMLILVFTPVIWQHVAEFLDIDTIPNWLHSVGMEYWRIGLTTLFMFIAVSGIYWILPNIKQRWSNVFPGAIMVVMGWTIGGVLFASYLATFDQVNLVYGSLGGIIIALLFFYILSVILIFGAEFNYRITTMLGEKISPREIVRKKKRAASK